MVASPEERAARPRFVRIALGFSILLLLAAGAFVGYVMHERSGSGGVLSNAIGGPFRLIDQNGKPFTDADLKGKWHLVFFGYTHCPDICPTTLNELSLALNRLDKQKRAEIDIVFISVDPERDTPGVLKSYVASFDGPIVALTGSAAAVKQAAQDYRVYYAKHPRTDGGYDMDHSAIIYVMDPQGRFAASLSPDEAARDIEAKLQKLVS